MNVLVVGAGNESCGDDGVGPLVARLVDDLAAPGVQVAAARADGLALLEEWTGFDRVVIVDAAVSGAPPGTVQRIDAAARPLPGSLRNVSSHGFGVIEVVELARALGRLPRALTVYAIEGARFEPGEDLTPPVREAAAEVAREIAGLGQHPRMTQP